MHSAAWRISLWATVAFACSTMFVFFFVDRFVANDIQRRSDAWLTGEIEVLGDVAERTPDNNLYSRVLSEVAELAAHEVPNRLPGQDATNRSVFFVQTTPDGALKLWVGVGDEAKSLGVIQAGHIAPDHPVDIRLPGYSIPFRVASASIRGGSQIYLGLSERDEQRVLRNLRRRFSLLSLSLVGMGFVIVFFTTRRTLSHVRQISEAASRIGHANITARVPTTRRNDEIAHLALTLNRMLDRIEASMHQLHTITDSLAHDLRSPLTAIRGKLETSLSSLRDGEHAEPIVAAIDELDRLTDFLNKSLDVAEAKADALRLSPTEIDLHELLRAMVDVYEPSMTEKGLHLNLHSDSPIRILADAGLVHRMIANLFDNELKHLPHGCTIALNATAQSGQANLSLSDNGRGFDPDVLPHLFERRVKGKASNGHGLGLAFVDAVVRAHGGTIRASNAPSGGAQIEICLPLAPASPSAPHSTALAAG